MTLTEIVKLAEDLKTEGIDPATLMEIALVLAEHDKRIAALEAKQKDGVE